MIRFFEDFEKESQRLRSFQRGNLGFVETENKEAVLTEEEFGNDDPFAGDGLEVSASLDLSKLADREFLVARWYFQMAQLASDLEFHTGKSLRRVSQDVSNPVEILREQQEFLNEFMIETERIARER